MSDARSDATASTQVTIAREHSALSRVAALVARGGASERVFDAIAGEASSLLDGQATTLSRFDGDFGLIVVATSGGPVSVGRRIEYERGTLPDLVRRREKDRVRIDDYRDERDAALAAEFNLVAAASVPILVENRVWGMLTATSASAPLPTGTEDRLDQFAKLVAAALANSQARAELRSLADAQTALRRVAELTARGEPTETVLEAVAVEASRLAGVEFGMVLRFEPDGSTEIVALDGAPPNFQIGLRAPAAGDSAVRRVWRTGRAARIDDLGAVSGQWPRMAAEFGFTTSSGVPVFLHGRLWGTLVVVGREAPILPLTETHLAEFAELVSTAISAAQAREELHVLASEQAALRRVAELVARGSTLDEVFAAVAAEASKLLGDLAAALLRFDPGDIAVVVAACNSPAPQGLQVQSSSDTPAGEVRLTGRPVRVDKFADTPLAEQALKLGVETGVAVPISVEGRVWGALTTSSPGPPLPEETEQRLAQFAELAAAGIANAENKEKLTESRARIIATADETRRQLQRDLHDGCQQRLVHSLIALKRAREAQLSGEPAAELIDEALDHAEQANRGLRDLVRGILPAALTRGGLEAAIESLADDIPIPIDVTVDSPRLPIQTETTGYYVVAEALTNVVKHARATRAAVRVELSNGVLSIEVNDDGWGGADPVRGTGLTGLRDRVEANAGSLLVESHPATGTRLRAILPVSDAP